MISDQCFILECREAERLKKEAELIKWSPIRHFAVQRQVTDNVAEADNLERYFPMC